MPIGSPSSQSKFFLFMSAYDSGSGQSGGIRVDADFSNIPAAADAKFQEFLDILTDAFDSTDFSIFDATATYNASVTPTP